MVDNVQSRTLAMKSRLGFRRGGAPVDPECGVPEFHPGRGPFHSLQASGFPSALRNSTNGSSTRSQPTSLRSISSVCRDTLIRPSYAALPS